MDVGIESSDTSFLMSLIGICNTVGRIIAGWISDHPKVSSVENICSYLRFIATIETVELKYCGKNVAR